MREFQATLYENARGTLSINEILLAMVSRPYIYKHIYERQQYSVINCVNEKRNWNPFTCNVTLKRSNEKEL